MKYFLKQIIIYTLLVSGFLFIYIDSAIDDLSGKEVESTVKFVYEAF